MALALVVATGAAGVCLAGASIGAGGVTLFERFAVQRGTRVASSAVVGRVDADGTYAVVSAIVLENARYTPGRMRGLRIDFASDTAADRVHVAADELPYLKQDLAGMGCSASRHRGQPLPDNVRVHGIASCRPSASRRPPLCPSYYRGPDGEGLGFGTRGGHSFRFPSPDPGKLAKTLVDAIGRAMERLGIDDATPLREPQEIRADVLERIVASAVDHFPQLAASPGVKAAGYSSEHSRAWLIFEPYARSAELGHSMAVDCRATGIDQAVWQCENGRPRGYLDLPGQERDVVIMGAMNVDDALALIARARTTLGDDPDFAGAGHWSVSHIRPLDESGNAFNVVLRDTALGGVVLGFTQTDTQDGTSFELQEYGRIHGSDCDDSV